MDEISKIIKGELGISSTIVSKLLTEKNEIVKKEVERICKGQNKLIVFTEKDISELRRIIEHINISQLNKSMQHHLLIVSSPATSV